MNKTKIKNILKKNKMAATSYNVEFFIFISSSVVISDSTNADFIVSMMKSIKKNGATKMFDEYLFEKQMGKMLE